MQSAVAGQIKDAQVKGFPLVLRSVLGYVAASRAAQGGNKAFMDATKYLVSNMLRSVAKKLEIEMLYGQMGYGAVGAVGGALAANQIQIATAEWAPGIWAGAEGMPVEIRDAASVSSPGTSVSRGEFKVTAVNMDTRVITLDSSMATAGVIATDVIWHRGAFGNEFPGVHKILTNTGVLFNISATQFNLFKGNEYDAAGALSFTKLGQAAVRGVEKGQEGKLLALVNPRGWQKMLSDQAALRNYDSSYSPAKMESGAKTLVFHSQNGVIEIEASLYVKEGHAFLLSLDDWMRVGSSDISFKRPGQGDDFFRDLENSAGYELRLYTDQALFCQAPGRNTIITGIDNT